MRHGVSLATQVFVLGSVASTLAAQLDMPVGVLLAGLLPHAMVEIYVSPHLLRALSG